MDDPLTRILCEQLGLFDQQQSLRFSHDVAPASTISMIKQGNDGQRSIEDAVWWLLMDKSQDGYKANYKYASFNSRSDKLNSPQAIAYQPYRTSRCIIPASSFVEGQDKQYHQLTPVNSAIGFGGIYKTWVNENNGERLHSASIITIPGHSKFEHIHRKSLPLMLPMNNQHLIEAWLNPQFDRVEKFDKFLQPFLRHEFTATPIDKPSKRNPIGLSETISMDIRPA
ncbi:MAG: putative SOS response-associated peptidase YedK [Alteromonadaceae bacterium]|jgi:putative SOS response-associated peptidase YedK